MNYRKKLIEVALPLMPLTRLLSVRNRYATGTRARCTCGGRAVRWQRRGR